MTFPSAVSDLLMCNASSMRMPLLSLFFRRSLPARSTRWSLPMTPPGGVLPPFKPFLIVTSIVKTVWLRDDVSFIDVASVALSRRPRSMMFRTSADEFTGSLARPLTKTMPSLSSRISSLSSYHWPPRSWMPPPPSAASSFNFSLCFVDCIAGGAVLMLRLPADLTPFSVVLLGVRMPRPNVSPRFFAAPWKMSDVFSVDGPW